MNPDSKKRCQQCNAWSERKTRRSRTQHHNLLHPRLHGNGNPAGGSPTTSIRFKNGITAKKTWGDPYEKWCIIYWGAAQRTETIWIWNFFGYHTIGNRWQQSTFTDGGCRRIISYTSYSRTNDCINNGYVNDNLEHNTMINIDTVAHMNMHYTQSWAHWAHFIDAPHVTSWLKLSSPRHPIHACPFVRCVVVVLFTRLLFFSVPLLFFQTFQMSSSEFHEKFKSKDLRDFRLGTVASSDHETPLTLFAMTFDPIFRWLQEAVIPRNPGGLDLLQPAQCAYADDLAVAASSFRDSMTALAPAFHSVDHTAGLNLTYCKCCWESLWHWLSENCGEFREMQIVRYAKYVGTMIGPDGYIYRWKAPRKKSSSVCWLQYGIVVMVIAWKEDSFLWRLSLRPTLTRIRRHV